MNKYLEVRDSCTCMPVLAVPIEINRMTRSVGFVSGQFILVTKLVNTQTHHSPEYWPDEWHRSVHRAILDNWEILKDGDVLDMRVVRGEAQKAVPSQFLDSSEFYNTDLGEPHASG